MHPMVRTLANRYGVQIKERCANDTWVFDGESIATYRIKHTYPQFVEYAPLVEEPVSSILLRSTDHELLHDIAHFVVAAEEQRDLPEFGLFPINRFCKGIETVAPDYAGVVDGDEQTIQECMVQILCIHWGRRYSISPHIVSNLDPAKLVFDTWDEYESFKRDEWNRTSSREDGKLTWSGKVYDLRFKDIPMLAIYRLHKQGLLEA